MRDGQIDERRHDQDLLFGAASLAAKLFIGHGSQKPFGVLGGAGLGGTAEMFEKLALRPGAGRRCWPEPRSSSAAHSWHSGVSRALAAVVLIAVMTAAVIAVDEPNGIWKTERGDEENFVLATTAFAVIASGR